MWPRECFLVLLAVILIAGVSSAHSPRFGTDAVISKRSVTPDKPDEQQTPENLQKPVFSSCKEIPTKDSGKYEIQLGLNKTRLSVYCEQTAHGGGWIVFQYRYNGKENFNRSWAEYRDGFGSLDGEFWLGLERVHQLTSARPHELMVEMKDLSGNYGYVKYNPFTIASESEGYKLSVGSYEGTAAGPYGLNYIQTRTEFMTYDRDPIGCVYAFESPWWNCGFALLNGNYHKVKVGFTHMLWKDFKDDFRALAYSRMMIRELD